MAGTRPAARLFVYGTLMPGHCRWSFVAPFVAGHRPGAVAGALWDTGRDYPAATFDGGKAGTVAGRVLDLRPERAAAALEVLDLVEGDEYERVEVVTEAGERCTTYRWRGPVAALRRLPEGRWTGA